MIRPSSSTCSGIRFPLNPRCDTATFTTSDVPRVTDRGGSTRLTWMSRASASRPTPTVKTGTPAARSPTSGAASDARELSAPSLTTTTPESGSPAISCRTRSSARPRSVRVPAYDSSATSATRSTSAAKRKNRSWNLSASADTSGAEVSPKFFATNAPRGSPPSSAIRMLRESSISTATKFCCGTAVASRSDGRSRQNSSTPSTATRNPTSTSRSRRPTGPPTRVYAHTTGTATANAHSTTTSTGHGAANTNSPRWKTTGRYRNSNSNSDSTIAR